MRTHVLFASVIGCTLLLSATRAQIRYVAFLDGSQENPPVVTAARGGAELRYDASTMTLSINVNSTGLSAVAAHVHAAPRGQNGGVIIPLSGGPTQWTGSGVLSTVHEIALRNQGLYLNLHTAANPGGEIRGQIIPPPVVINEFSYDDSGTDDREFVEIYNRTCNPVDISGWVLDGSDPFGPNAAYVVPGGTVLAGGDYYVFGSALVPNVDQVVGATNLWENDQESLVLRDSFLMPQDALVYEANKGLWAGSPEEGEGIWGNMTSIDFKAMSWSRVRDGYDTDNNADFIMVPETPGDSNNRAGTNLMFRNGSEGAPDTNAPGFPGSFVDIQIIDPLVTSVANPNALAVDSSAAGGSGGNCYIGWDPAGGGNYTVLNRDGHTDVDVEMLVYFDAVLEPTGENETWSIGIQGTGATFYNTPDPGGTFGFTANGNTGISWTYQVTDASATLYLVDHNDGGWGAGAKTNAIVLATIPLTAGTNDGWQRLRLAANGNNLVAEFGGTLGLPGSGAVTTATISRPQLGCLYIGYREFIGVNSTTRPPTFDDLSYFNPNSLIVYTGNAVPTNAGTPRIVTNRIARLGDVGLTMRGTGLVPNFQTTFFLAASLAVVPLDLSLFGGQAGSFFYLDLLGSISIPAPTNANGEATLALPLPCIPVFLGASTSWQILDFDPSLGIALPLGNSNALTATITN